MLKKREVVILEDRAREAFLLVMYIYCQAKSSALHLALALPLPVCYYISKDTLFL